MKKGQQGGKERLLKYTASHKPMIEHPVAIIIHVVGQKNKNKRIKCAWKVMIQSASGNKFAK